MKMTFENSGRGKTPVSVRYRLPVVLRSALHV